MPERLPRLTEAQFTATLIELARLRGWLVYHQRAAWTNKGWRTAVQGDPGFPDLVLVRVPAIIFVELKTSRRRLEVSPDQERWLSALRRCAQKNPYVRCELWTPDDWPQIEEALK